jgi:hypothetical protein
MKTFPLFDSTFDYFTSNTAIAIYLVILAALIIVISFTTIFDLKKKNEFKRQSDAERAAADKKAKKARFPELLDFDRAHPADFEEEPTDPAGLGLASFCERFRDFMAGSPSPLYYSREDVMRFVASLTVSKTMILQGMSGTGKTSLAVAFGRFIGVPAAVVPVQPMWKERSDLLGYYNEFTGRFSETPILERLYEAAFSDRIFVIVLDELNIARVEYYFSEFLSLLELPAGSSRELTVAASGAPGDPRKMSHGRIALPANVWFLGTANNDDSTFAISDKVYDRAMVMDLNSRAEPRRPEGPSSPVRLSAAELSRLAEKARAEHPLSAASLRRIRELDDYLVAAFHVTFGNRILMQMKAYAPAYVACGGTEQGAVDDMLAKKVLRKLESQNPVYVKSKSEELIARLDSVFGEGNTPICQELIRRIVNNA